MLTKEEMKALLKVMFNPLSELQSTYLRKRKIKGAADPEVVSQAKEIELLISIEKKLREGSEDVIVEA